MANQSVKQKTTRRKSRSQTSKRAEKDTNSANRPAGKLGLILERLSDTDGATLEDLVKATSWQKHSVRGALSRLRSHGFVIRLEAVGDRKVYQLLQTAG